MSKYNVSDKVEILTGANMGVVGTVIQVDAPIVLDTGTYQYYWVEIPGWSFEYHNTPYWPYTEKELRGERQEHTTDG